MSLVLKLFSVVVAFSQVAGAPSHIESRAAFLEDMYDNENYTKPNQRSGKSLKAWSEAKGKGNPEEQGSYYEGDILLDVKQKGLARNGVINEHAKWTNNVVPYEIKGTFTAKEKNLIGEAIDRIQSRTCIKFEPRRSEKDYISIQNRNIGCFSSVGKKGGKQIVNLQSPSCVRKIGTAVHELLHVLGLFHEQSRSDRDQHVRINFDNIIPSLIGNFRKMPASEISSYGVEYNVASILHYSPFAFSKNKKKTIDILQDSTLNSQIGQRDDLTDNDVEKVNAMYCPMESVHRKSGSS